MKLFFTVLPLLMLSSQSFASNCNFSEKFTPSDIQKQTVGLTRPLDGGYLPLQSTFSGKRLILGMEEWSRVRSGKIVTICVLDKDFSCPIVSTNMVYYGEQISFNIEVDGGSTNIDINCE